MSTRSRTEDEVEIAGIMEHIEEAGIHSGDSACSLPPYSLSAATIAEIERQTVALAQALGVVGLMNVQFAVKDGDIYVLEVNPRASRTVPFVAKATGVPIAKIAARVMIGEPLAGSLRPRARHRAPCRGQGGGVSVRALPGRRPDPRPGNEVDRRGHGARPRFRPRLCQVAARQRHRLPLAGCVFVSVRDHDKAALVEPCRRLVEMGFTLVATEGTADTLAAAGLPVSRVNKVREGRPHIVDHMLSGGVQLVFNTTEGAQAIADSFSLRRTALTHADSLLHDGRRRARRGPGDRRAARREP